MLYRTPFVPHFAISQPLFYCSCFWENQLRASVTWKHFTSMFLISLAFCSGAFLLWSQEHADKWANFELQGGSCLRGQQPLMCGGWAPVEKCSLLLLHGQTILRCIPHGSSGSHQMEPRCSQQWPAAEWGLGLTFFLVSFFPVAGHQFLKINHPHANPFLCRGTYPKICILLSWKQNVYDHFSAYLLQYLVFSRNDH